MNSWETRILHLGLGRFHRAHQAMYYQRLADQGDRRWGCVSFSMRSDEARDQLRSVGLRYPVVELAHDFESTTWVEAIREVGSAVSDVAKLMHYFAKPTIDVLTLTVTEKAYVSGGDTIKLIAQGLRERMKASAGPLTILSCDNLRGNGKKLRQLVIEELQGEEITWLQKYVRFPSTMVDRIVPALTQEKTLDLEFHLGRTGTQVVATEAFSQWVIEDDFIGERPAWDLVGVQFVKDVTPFEEAKLRLLNASHSFLAYGGLIRGHEFVHQAVADEELCAAVTCLQRMEVLPLLETPAGLDLNTYCERIMERFTNEKLPHQLRQIAMDGTQKLPQRILASLRLACERDSLRQELLQAVVFWLRYSYQTLKSGDRLDDPLASVLSSRLTADWPSWPAAALAAGIFPRDLSPQLEEEIISAALA